MNISSLRVFNDREEDARALAEALSGKECVVNLIPANPVPEKGFRRQKTGMWTAFSSTSRSVISM